MKDALILFTRVPIPGQTKTRLMPFLTGEECARLHACFVKDIYEKAKQVDADIFVFFTPKDEKKLLQQILDNETVCLPQFGDDLGERMKNAEIAAKLHVAESSVRTYINRMLEKTGYTNRNRLMVAAVSKRLVVPSSQLDV